MYLLALTEPSFSLLPTVSRVGELPSGLGNHTGILSWTLPPTTSVTPHSQVLFQSKTKATKSPFCLHNSCQLLLAYSFDLQTSLISATTHTDTHACMHTYTQYTLPIYVCLFMSRFCIYPPSKDLNLFLVILITWSIWG